MPVNIFYICLHSFYSNLPCLQPAGFSFAGKPIIMNIKIFTAQPAWAQGITFIRIITGILIIMFGKEIFDEGIMANYTGFLTEMHFPFPKSSAYLAKIVELTGGVLLILGLFTRLIVWPLTVTMAVIIWYMSGGNFLNGGTASCFVLLFLVFFFTGPGKFSLDYVLFNRDKEL
jgi:uncharacterized membrane protein YphA (DoxX/SURF4 family)